MNGNQKGILIMGITVFAIMGSCPPWVFRKAIEGITFEQDLGYEWVWKPATYRLVYNAETILATVKGCLDLSRLCVQWGVVAAVTGGLMAAFGAKRKGKTKNAKPNPSSTGIESSKEPPLAATLQN